MEQSLAVKLDPDAGADFLARKLQNRDPFFFVRYGDGALECINRLGRGKTCDGELYTSGLGSALHRAWKDLATGGASTVIGDWRSASFSGDHKTLYLREYEELLSHVSDETTFVHFESLLLMRDSTALWNFYRAVRDDVRRKVLVGPAGLEIVARVLRCEHIAIPITPHLFAIRDTIANRIAVADFDVLLYGVGMAGNVPVVDHWNAHREKTYINLGSALDPLHRGRTRKQQLVPTFAKDRFYQELV